jgi:hypothetical protein
MRSHRRGQRREVTSSGRRSPGQNGPPPRTDQPRSGAFLANLVLGGCAAYRMQLFLYLKASSAPTINSANLWSGMDSPTQA